MEINKLHDILLNSAGVATDSRVELQDKIFFALSGENFDGNKFTNDALDKGACYVVIDNSDYLINSKCILVEDVLTTLQKLAAYHRKNSKAVVIGITGSNGKTTTKELISKVLSTNYNIIATQGNFNNHIGVPLTLLSITADTEIAVVEMGANHSGEIATLCNIANPDYGIITNIGAAHLEGFGSFEGVIATKNELYLHLQKNNGTAIVNNDDERLMKLSANIKKITYGKINGDIVGEILSGFPYLQIKWISNNNTSLCNTQIYGNYNLYNILAAATVGTLFKINNTIINTALELYVANNNRSQIITTENNNKIILDAYNANPYSMMEAIKSFTSGNFNNPVLILGDMFELGKYSESEHQNIVSVIKQTTISNVILVGKEFAKTVDHVFTSIKTTDEAIMYFESQKIKNHTILIKGSRGMQMERLLTVL